MLALLHNVLLRQYRVAFESPTLALSRDGSDPLQREIFGFGELAGILDVIPDAVGNPPQFPLDFFAFSDRIQLAAPLEPPKTAS